MSDEQGHSASVAAWLDRVGREVSAESLVLSFEKAFEAVWRRTHKTLGDVTLTAILDRVLHVTIEKYPALSSIKMEAAGISCHGLRERAGALDRAELEAGLCFVLEEFLTVLGNLTADILTPPLHLELSKVEPDEKSNGARR